MPMGYPFHAWRADRKYDADAGGALKCMRSLDLSGDSAEGCCGWVLIQHGD